MEDNDNLLSSYCFLAALTENQNDLFNHVYVPICKRTLSLYGLSGATHGTAADIKKIINDEYGIDIPYIMVKRLINAAFKSLSGRARSKTNFKVFDNGESFEIQKYAFSDLEIQYKKGARNANALQLAFHEYLKNESIEIDTVPTFTEFLNKNKKHLASFFNGTAIINGKCIDKTFIHHIQFIELIETSNHDLFEIAKGLYLGSIVAGFLESGLDIEPKSEENIIYYLDTPIILRALDLQKEEETEPTNELLELIRKTSGKLKVLSITIDEIHKVIENAIGNYNNSVPTTTINEAVLRLEKNKAWLISYNGKLEQNILSTIKAEKQDIVNSFKDAHQKSPDIKSLQDKRLKKGNALHDVLAYLYVREQRGGDISLYQKAKAWFLTSNADLLKFNREHSTLKSISEIVLPDALTSLLWLKNPSALLSKVQKIGLSELMASTLNEEIASRELINEFESNITKLDDITPDDYRILLESVAHQSAKKIEHFNEIAATDTNQAKIEAHKIVEWEKSRKAKRTKAIKDAQLAKQEEVEKNKELAKKLAEIETNLSNSNLNIHETSTQIELLSSKISQQRKSTNRILFSIFLLGIVSLIYYLKVQGLIDFKSIYEWILGAGGLFGLGNLIFNAIRFFKKDK